MARIRYLKPEFFSDEDLAELPFQTRLTFAGLWCFADKAGRLEDRSKFLKAMIFPYDNVDMEKQLQALSNGKGFIQRYEVEDKKFIQIVSWDKHQKPHHTERESNFPPAPPFKDKDKDKDKDKPARSELDLSNGLETVNSRLKKVKANSFDIFWNKYPKKVGRPNTFKEWNRIKPDLETVLSALKAQIEQKERLLSENKFCPEWPDPERWIKNQRWLDEIQDPTPLDATDRLIYEMKKEREKDGHTEPPTKLY